MKVTHISSGSIGNYQVVTMKSSSFKHVADFDALDTNLARFYRAYRGLLSVAYNIHPHNLILLPKAKNILKIWRSANDDITRR